MARSIATKRLKNRHRISFTQNDVVIEHRLLLTADLNLIRVNEFKPLGGGLLKVNYEQLAPAGQVSGLHFDVYRSNDASFDSSDRLIASTNAAISTLADNSPKSLTVDAGQAMRPDPFRPFVVVVARATGPVAENVTTDNTLSFRKYTIAVVCHGGIQGSHYNIPTWEMKIGHSLQAYDYDRVIAFNWANKSWTAGAAAKQAPRMAKRLLKEAASLPAGASIDIDYIAHSEGTVVVTQAQKFLDKNGPGPFATGYKRMSLLDPHAANPSAPNNAESTAGGFTGWLTKRIISWYKGNAHDPLVQVPSSVNEADVYYQRTPVSINPVNGGLYNLLGQVPVVGSARYIQLNSPGIAHSGGGGVYTWFYFNAMPSFASGDQPKNPSLLKATSVSVSSGGWDGIKLFTTDTQPVYSGQATPGATVKIYATPVSRKPDNSRPAAVTTADASGKWILSPNKPLGPGNYRVFARAFVDCGLPRPNMKLMPTVRLGRLQIPTSQQLKAVRLAHQTSPLPIPETLNTDGLGIRLSDEIQSYSLPKRVSG